MFRRLSGVCSVVVWNVRDTFIVDLFAQGNAWRF
jgi:hypothetical protein